MAKQKKILCPNCKEDITQVFKQGKSEGLKEALELFEQIFKDWVIK